MNFFSFLHLPKNLIRVTKNSLLNKLYVGKYNDKEIGKIHIRN